MYDIRKFELAALRLAELHSNPPADHVQDMFVVRVLMDMAVSLGELNAAEVSTCYAHRQVAPITERDDRIEGALAALLTGVTSLALLTTAGGLESLMDRFMAEPDEYKEEETVGAWASAHAELTKDPPEDEIWSDADRSYDRGFKVGHAQGYKQAVLEEQSGTDALEEERQQVVRLRNELSAALIDKGKITRALEQLRIELEDQEAENVEMRQLLRSLHINNRLRNR